MAGSSRSSSACRWRGADRLAAGALVDRSRRLGRGRRLLADAAHARVHAVVAVRAAPRAPLAPLHLHAHPLTPASVLRCAAASLLRCCPQPNRHGASHTGRTVWKGTHVSLLAVARDVAEPDHAAAAARSPRDASDLEPQRLAEHGGGLVREPAVAHSAPLVVVLDLNPARLVVAVREAREVRVRLAALVEVRRPHTDPELAELRAVAAQPDVVCVMALHSHSPRRMLAVTHVSLCANAVHVCEPDFLVVCEFAVRGVSPTASREPESFAQGLCVLIAKVPPAHGPPAPCTDTCGYTRAGKTATGR
eukprot:2200478-Rhodomonas_salina.1